MQYQTWLSAAFLLLATQSATAQATLNCADLDATKPFDAQRAFECISAMDEDLKNAQSEIMDLRAQVAQLSALSARVDTLMSTFAAAQSTAVPALGDHAETRAIVAYVSSKGEKTCPKGWVPFEAAKDRFIIGAGAQYPVVGSTGGAAEVTLSEAQMPNHTHAMPYVSITTDLGWRNAGTTTNMPYFNVPSSGSANRVTVGKHHTGVFETGGNQPHTNIPPFIALYYCQKAG